MKYVILKENPDLAIDVIGYCDDKNEAQEIVNFYNKEDTMCDVKIAQEYEYALMDSDDTITEGEFVEKYHPEITVESLTNAYQFYILHDIPYYFYKQMKSINLIDIQKEH